jgi:hypothetical protein
MAQQRVEVLYGCEAWCFTLREEERLSMFENRMLRIFGPKRDEMTGGWRKFYNEVLHNLYSSPNIRVIKSRRAYCMYGGEMSTKFWLESLMRRDHSEDIGIAGRIILKWILGKSGLGCGLN